MDFLGKSKRVNFDLAIANLPQYEQSGAGSEKLNSPQLNSESRKKTQEMLYDACFDGTMGSFNRVKNDFSLETDDLANNESRYFQNKPDWSQEDCKRVKKFRFVIATMTLIALLLCLTSRTVINVGIVEMTKSQTSVQIQDEPIIPQSDNEQRIENDNNSRRDVKRSIDQENDRMPNNSYQTDPSIQQQQQLQSANNVVNDVVVEEGGGGEYRIDWTPKKKNYLISSFYMGYAPSMMFTGGLANRYGAWWPLFLAVFMSFLINAVTPLITSYSYTLLFTSRVVLGIFQGCVMPATYDIFSKWLTMTETSIFAPMIKVSFGMGALIGSALPFLTNYFGYDWPYLFYESSFLCGIWSILWYFLATSTPQTNKWVEPNELKRIMRKKLIYKSSTSSNEKSTISTIKLDNYSNKDNQNNTKNNNNNNNCFKLQDLEKLESTTTTTKNDLMNNIDYKRSSSIVSIDLERESTPWLLIAFNPSVIALAVTKFTYNIGADFVCLELALYLDRIHKVSMNTISQISSAGFLMQAVLATGVGWLAKYVVQNKSFGLSKSKWRKIFQAFSNFGMSIIYLILAFADPDYTTIVCLILVVFFLWMFGAGGESIVAYDLSLKYPATITGFAHSIGILSSVSLPAFCDLVLQQEDSNNERWKTVFLMIAILTLLGGFVFILFLKPKPFLPGEKEEKRRKSSALR